MTSPRTLLATWDLRARKKLGQNFLADPSTSEMIVKRANLGIDDIVIEIGPGLGALTVPTAKKVKKIYAIEKDTELLPILRSELLAKEIENVEIINQDILKTNLNEIAAKHKERVIVIGNLPYNISSQIIMNLIKERELFEKAIFMFQKELAERLAAPPATKNYGRISAVLQYFSTISTVANVKSNLFYPKPNVDSSVIEINFNKEILDKALDEDDFIKIVKAAFSKRRKTLKNAISRSELKIDSETTIKILELAEIDPVRRAETLKINEFVMLSNEYSKVK
ncbi:MAG: ribosomal RNA small subunit methyltransferase A [Desulfobacterales bacterium]|nr:ribosomal RNA small subunit methyltransferase A [Desulfobacterales bacterium]MCP4162227.1 ribosomal RNA small subunit methyltransferase A [Deltaproteobacteria bacterium]